jgi:hypothetical protein
VALRSVPPPTEAELDRGVPLFLEQLVDALRLGLPSTEVRLTQRINSLERFFVWSFIDELAPEAAVSGRDRVVRFRSATSQPSVQSVRRPMRLSKTAQPAVAIAPTVISSTSWSLVRCRTHISLSPSCGS